MTETIDPLGHTTTNTYDANQNLLSTTDALNHITCYTYDSNGNRTSVTFPQAGPTCSSIKSTAAYNQYSEPTQTTDELGNVPARVVIDSFPSRFLLHMSGPV